MTELAEVACEEGGHPPSYADEARRRRALRNVKEVARARCMEGRRLALQRDIAQANVSSAPQRVGRLHWRPTDAQREMLRRWGADELCREFNEAIAASGHGRLRGSDGKHLDVGGSIGGGPCGVIDGWVMPDWWRFLEGSGA